MSSVRRPAPTAVPGGVRYSKHGPDPAEDPVCLDYLQAYPELIDPLLVEHGPSRYGDCPVCERPYRRFQPCDVWRLADRARGRRELSLRVEAERAHRRWPTDTGRCGAPQWPSDG